MGMETDPVLLQDHYETPWTYLLSSFAAINGDQPIERILLYLPRYGWFPAFPGMHMVIG